MSQSQYTYQTVTTINVSQDFETPVPSSPTGEPRAPPGLTRQETEVVEDSLNANLYANGPSAKAPHTEVIKAPAVDKATIAANPKSPLNRPVQRPHSQDDELYSLTPEHLRAKATQTSTNTKAAPQHKVSNNALDALLTKGAAVHKADEISPKSTRIATVAGGMWSISSRRILLTVSR